MRRYTATLTANNTATISLNENEDAQILLTQGNVGSYSVTWASVNKWFTPSGNPPVLKTAIGSSDLITLWRTGGVVYGTHGGDSGPAGSTGAAGPAGLNWKGQWSSGTGYLPADAVYQSGSSYFCLTANGPATTVVTPGTDSTVWSLLCAGGSGTTGGAAIIDNFQRANGLITAGSPPFTWTKILTATASITSNLAEDDDFAALDCVYRAESVLTSADHQCSITLGNWTTSAANFGLGACVRFAAAAQTYYLGIAEWQNTNVGRFRILKCVAGSITELANVSATSLGITIASTGVLKMAAAGSATTTLTLTYNNATAATVTDSSSPITGNVRCGFHTYRGTSATHASMSDFRYST